MHLQEEAIHGLQLIIWLFPICISFTLSLVLSALSALVLGIKIGCVVVILFSATRCSLCPLLRLAVASLALLNR